MKWLLLIVIVLTVFFGTLYTVGRDPISKSGKVFLWAGNVHSSENSQQLSDWYTPSHIIHGFLIYFLLWILTPNLPIGLRLLLAISLECSWEILENSPLIIDRYRAATASVGYYGDSILNSFSDVIAMVLGFEMARRLPVWTTITLAVLFELVVGFFIHDNLTLNVVMLVHPSKAILDWQMLK